MWFPLFYPHMKHLSESEAERENGLKDAQSGTDLNPGLFLSNTNHYIRVVFCPEWKLGKGCTNPVAHSQLLNFGKQVMSVLPYVRLILWLLNVLVGKGLLACLCFMLFVFFCCELPWVLQMLMMILILIIRIIRSNQCKQSPNCNIFKLNYTSNAAVALINLDITFYQYHGTTIRHGCFS